jgi:hypothetical protein
MAEATTKPVPIWYPWISAIASKLLLAPEVRWDRFVYWGREMAFYGWIDRDDGRSDFFIAEFSLYPGGRVSVGTLTSSPDIGEDVDRRMRDDDNTVPCQRIEDHFGTLADLNVVRLEEGSK